MKMVALGGVRGMKKENGDKRKSTNQQTNQPGEGSCLENDNVELRDMMTSAKV